MDTLIQLLRDHPDDPSISALIQDAESRSDIDLKQQSDLLSGVWELRWSSASQPWLKQAGWLENLQILDPAQGRGMNVLRFNGPLRRLAALTVEAELTTISATRVSVRFRKGGWMGPGLPGGRKIALMKTVNQGFPAWLEITALDDTLRICRGNAGTTFALLRREDMAVSDFISAFPKA